MHAQTTLGYTILLDDDIASLIEGLALRESRFGTIQVYDRSLGRMSTLGRIVMGLEPTDTRRVRTRGSRHDYRRENLYLVSAEKNLSLRDRTQTGLKARDRLHGENMNPAKATSPYRGVTLVHPNGKRDMVRYQSRFTVNGRTRSLGLFETEEDAARAYDRARIKHGLSPVNFIDAE